MVKLVDKVLLDNLECLESRDLEVPEDLKVVVVLKEVLECPEQKVRKEEWEQTVLLDPLVFLGLLDPLEIEELLVYPDQLDLLVQGELLVLKESVGTQEKLVKKGHLDLLVCQVQLDLLDPEVQEEKRDLLESPVLLELVDVLVIKDLLVLQDQWVLQGVLVFQVLQEKLVLLVHLVKEENEAKVDLPVLLDLQECQVNPDHLVYKVHLVKLVNVVTRVVKVIEA